jgi:uncharacterized repeat protein (TIGR01451 family)
MMKWLGLALVGLLAGAFGASANGPAKMAPGNPDSGDYLYVFGPGGSRLSGREDSLQVVFFQVPVAQAENVTLYVYDPGAGSSFEKASWFSLGRTTSTTFTVYGGAGALSGSQTVRPTAQQAGTVLATKEFRSEGQNEWVSFGPFSAKDAEVVDGVAYFKLVAQATSGSTANFFKVGVSSPAAEIFAFDSTLHFIRPVGEVMSFSVEVPAGVSVLKESNYDYDTGGTPQFAGQKWAASSSGQWLHNKPATIEATAATRRIQYDIVKGTQGYANGGFYFTDGEGNPLRTYFVPQAVPARPAPPMQGCSALIETSLVSLLKVMPCRTSVGEEFDATLTVTAKQCAQHIHVIDFLPAGLTLVSSTPQAERKGDQLSWVIPEMDKGATQTITLRLRATAEGTFENCASIFAEPLLCVQTVAGKAALAIQKTGPAEALLGSNVAYNVVVSNPGTAVAKNVVVTDQVPEGLATADGKKTIVIPVGDLEPGASKPYTINLKAEKRGRFCNVANAAADNVAKVSAEACTVVKQPGLTITKTGTDKQYVGKVASYAIEVTNPGDVDLKNVVVTDTAPAGTRILSAAKATVNGNTATWTFPELKAGQKITGLVVELTSSQQGNLCNSASVATAEGLTQKAEACTLWIGHPALLIEVVDTKDPLLIGEMTSYVIRVTNQGSAPDTNVKVVANFPAQITPVTAAGDTATKVQGQSVDTAPYAVLKPQQAITWKIEAKAAQMGDSRLKVLLTSDLLKNPVTEEESTQVY